MSEEELYRNACIFLETKDEDAIIRLCEFNSDEAKSVINTYETLKNKPKEKDFLINQLVEAIKETRKWSNTKEYTIKRSK